MKQVYQVKGFGEVHFVQRKNSNRISLRVKKDGIITVNYPSHVSIQEAQKFLVENRPWVDNQQKNIESRSRKYAIGYNVVIKDFGFIVERGTQKEAYSMVDRDCLVVKIPADTDITEENIQEFIHDVFIEFLRYTAKRYLPNRVLELAAEHGFSFQKVFIKNLKSKWGSCSSVGNINLNLHLMQLPDHLIDYIILHELCHTVEMNHSHKFYALLNKVTNGKKEAIELEMSKIHLEHQQPITID